MKKVLFFAVLGLISLTSYAQNHFPPTGSVGIGTGPNPNAILDVKYQGGSINVYRATDQNGQYRWRVDQNFDMFLTNSGGLDLIKLGQSQSYFLNGNMSIGTTHTGNGKLTLNSNVATNLLRLENDGNGNEAQMRFRAKSTSGGTLHADMSLYATGGNTGFLGFKVPHDNNAGQSFDMVIDHLGRVGIGITDPQALLDIKYPSGPAVNVYRATDQNGQYRWRVDQNFEMFLTTAGGSDVIELGQDQVLLNSGNVAIGTTNSTNGRLTVNHSDPSNLLRLENDGNGNEAQLRFRAKSTTGGTLHADMSLYATGGNSGFLGFKVPHDNSPGQNFDMIIDHQGKVGIGTTTTGTHKLAVDGSIGARKVKVEMGSWSDFVFDHDYKLRSLAEVESFIAQNKHLPDVPSQAEVVKEGNDLGSMDAILLQKIEELTLYLIEQNKKIEALEKKLAEKNK